MFIPGRLYKFKKNKWGAGEMVGPERFDINIDKNSILMFLEATPLNMDPDSPNYILDHDCPRFNFVTSCGVVYDFGHPREQRDRFIEIKPG